MDIKFETSLKEEEENLVKEYYEIKKHLNDLVKKEEFLKYNIKNLMKSYNLKSINTNRMDLIFKESESVFYPKDEIERNVPIEILDRIRKIKKISILISKIKNGND